MNDGMGSYYGGMDEDYDAIVYDDMDSRLARPEPEEVECKRCHGVGMDDDDADCVYCDGMGSVLV